MGKIQRQTSRESQRSSDSETATTDGSDQTSDSSENSADLNKKFESSLHVSTKPKSKSTEAESDEQHNIPQASGFQESRPKISRQPSLMETDESSQSNVEMSKTSKINKMDQSRRQPSNESQDSSNSDAQISSDQTMDSSENDTDLNKRFESSLYVSKKPQSDSTEAESCQQYNTPQASGYRENRQKKSNRPSLMETLYRPYESSSSRGKMSNSRKTDDYKSSSAIKKTAEPNKDAGMQQRPLLPSGGDSTRSMSNYHQNAQYSASIFPTQYPPGFFPNANPSVLHRSTNPVQNQALTYTGQYPEQRFMDPNFAHIQNFYQRQIGIGLPRPLALRQINEHKTQFSFPVCRPMHSHQWQFQSPNIKTTARPVVLLPRNMRTYYNPMPPIRTNAIPLRYVKSSSYYRNVMPPVMTNAAPMRYVRPSSHYLNQKPPIMNNTTSMRQNQFTRTTAPNVSGGIDFTSNVLQNRLHLTSEIPDQVFKPLVIQPQKSALEETGNLNTIESNLEQSQKLAKTKEELTKIKEELTKTTEYSEKNILNVDVSKKLPEISLSPLYSTPQGGIAPRRLQRTPIQFPTPSSSDHVVYNSAVERGIIPHQPYQPYQLTSSDYSNIFPVVTEQPAPHPVIQDNVLVQSGLHVGNSPLPAIQAPIMKPCGVQYKPTMQNLTVFPQYQDPNHPICQYGAQYQPATQDVTAVTKYQDQNPTLDQYHPAMKNITAIQQYQDPNKPIYQYGTQVQSTMQNVTAAPHYQDQNLPAYQYGAQYQSLMQNQTIEPHYQDQNPPMDQYQPAMQNITATPRYHDPNQPMYQYGKQASVESSWPIDTPWSYPVHDASIPTQQENPNTETMQTPATYPFSSSMAQNPIWPYGSGDPSYPFTGDTNLVSNISGVQTYEENLSSISMSNYTPWPYVASGTTSQICRDNPYQGANPNQGYVSFNNPQITDSYAFPTWSVATDDSHKDVPIDETDKTSTNQ